MGIRIVSLVTGDDVILYGNEVQSELISNRAALVRNQFGSYLIPYRIFEIEHSGRLNSATVQLPRYVLLSSYSRYMLSCRVFSVRVACMPLALYIRSYKVIRSGPLKSLAPVYCLQ